MSRPRIFHEFTNKDGRAFEYSWFYSRMVFVEPLQADTSEAEYAVEEKDIVEGKGAK